MKQVFFLLGLFLMTSVVNAQQNNSNNNAHTNHQINKTNMDKPKQIANPAAYACPSCFEVSKGEGSCAKCGATKVQLGTYYCTKCVKGSGAKPGKCPTCSMATTQMTRKYCASKGGTPLKEHTKKSNG